MTRRGKKKDHAEQRGPINGMILDYMVSHNIDTVQEFADRVGASRQTIYDLVRGRSKADGSAMMPSLDTLTKLAKALRKPTHELLYLINPQAPGADIPMALDVAQVPVAIAGRAGAGPLQNYLLEGHTYVEREFAEGRDLIAFRISGNSMAGGRDPIYQDDLVIVDRNVGGEPNRPVVARLKDDGYVCKRLRPGGILDSTNPDYLDEQTAVIAPDRVAEIVGKVVRHIRTNL